MKPTLHGACADLNKIIAIFKGPHTRKLAVNTLAEIYTSMVELAIHTYNHHHHQHHHHVSAHAYLLSQKLHDDTISSRGMLWLTAGAVTGAPARVGMIHDRSIHGYYLLDAYTPHTGIFIGHGVQV